MKPGISIIVCCFNSEKRLSETLAHIINQKTSGLNWEVIIVDNASTDSTSAIAEKILSAELSVNNFTIVIESQPGLSSARRKGYLTSQYKYLLFCDDDNWLKENYLQSSFNMLEQNKNIGILGGKGDAIFEGSKPNWFNTYQLNFAVGVQSTRKASISFVETVYGAGFVVKREIFETLDFLGFQSLLSDRKGTNLMSGGDTELCYVTRYLGYQIAYSENLQFNHLMTEERMTWNYLKKLYHGFGRSRVYIQAYQKMENCNEIPNIHLKYPLWFDKYIHRLKELKDLLPSVLFSLNKEGNDFALRYTALCGELYELRTLKSNYTEIFEKILKLKQDIAGLKQLK